MGLFALAGNLIWIAFGGALSGFFWFFAGVIFAITIVGLPWSMAAFRIAWFSFIPFGTDIVSKPAAGFAGESVRALVRILWVIFPGFLLALWHLLIGTLFLITIIGFPFAMAHYKLARVAFFPVGVDVVSK